MKPTNLDNQALCQMLDAATDAMHQAGLGYMGAAGQEMANMQRLLTGPLARWTDAEGQRVALWLAELVYFDRHTDQRQRSAGFVTAASHIHRLALQRLLRNLGMRWPAQGLMLNPPDRPLDPQPKPLFDLSNVDLPPGHMRG